MLSSSRAAARFSLLLLEEGETYVGNWVATAQWPGSSGSAPAHAQGRTPGTLRLCTKSLFFDPTDMRLPIVRHGHIVAPVVQAQTLPIS